MRSKLQGAPEEYQAVAQAWTDFRREAAEAGALLSNNGLVSVADATTVRVRNEKTLTADGPFAETHEQLGGYCLFECKDIDEAIQWAQKIPPPTNLLPQRLDALLAVIYLIFNEGYVATSGDKLIRTDLCNEAIRLCRILVDLLPASAEAHGLLALMLLHDSRRETRLTPTGELVLLEEQDRTCWDPSKIREGVVILEGALSLYDPGPYQIQAAISALHSEATTAKDTNWKQIAALYDILITQHALICCVVQINGKRQSMTTKEQSTCAAIILKKTIFKSD